MPITAGQRDGHPDETLLRSVQFAKNSHDLLVAHSREQRHGIRT